MNRIDRIFKDLRASGGRALIPYVTAGDPDIATTGRLLPELESAGAAIVELGIPFSDPIADGPVIQASMGYALKRGLGVEEVFETVAARRASSGLGLLAMVSYSIPHRFGLKRFAAAARSAGIDGLILPDLPVEQSRSAADAAAEAGLILSMLIAPTTPPERARRIAEASSGFVYLLSRAGITGERAELPPDLSDRIRRLRDATDLPIAVGFGISSRRHVEQVVSVADAAIVGTALVRRLIESRGQGAEAVVRAVGIFTRELAAGLGAEGSRGRGAE